MRVEKSSLLIFAGVAGLIGTAVSAYRARRIVDETLYGLEREIANKEARPLNKKEKAKVYIKTMWPTFTLGAASVALIAIGNHKLISKKNAALAAYYISEGALIDYQKEMISELGEKKEREIRDRVAKKHADNITEKGPAIIVSEGDKPWVLDSETEALFRFSYDKLNWIITQANLDMEEGRVDGISVWDLYDRLGIKPPHNDKWAFVGWNSKYKIDPYFTSTVTEIMGQMQPCMVMEYRVKPMYDYDVYG